MHFLLMNGSYNAHQSWMVHSNIAIGLSCMFWQLEKYSPPYVGFNVIVSWIKSPKKTMMSTNSCALDYGKWPH
jgi:hypothetical protein